MCQIYIQTVAIMTPSDSYHGYNGCKQSSLEVGILNTNTIIPVHFASVAVMILQYRPLYVTISIAKHVFLNLN